MGLTYEQARSLGIGHLHPAVAPKTNPEFTDALNEAICESRKTKLHAKVAEALRDERDNGMNKTERAFAMMLDSQNIEYHFQQIKFRLAGRTWYTPDFAIKRPRTDTIVEVKGFMRDDASVKLKVAAETYPEFHWFLVRRGRNGGWIVHQVTRNGIGTSPINVTWIG